MSARKNFGRLALTLAMGAPTSLLAESAQQASTDFDVALINENIQGSIASLVEGYDGISSFYYALDAEKSDIDQDRYFIQLAATLQNTPWGDDQAKISGSLGIDYSAGKRGRNALIMSQRFETNPLQYIAYRAKTAQPCPSQKGLQGVRKIMADQSCAALESMKTAQSVTDLQRLLEQQISNTSQALQLYAQDLQQLAPGIANDTVRSWVEKQIRMSKKALDNLGKTRIESTENGFVIEGKGLPYRPMGMLKDFQLEIAQDYMHISGTVMTRLGLDSRLYQAIKPHVKDILQALQDDQAYAKKLILIDARFWLSIIKDLVTTEQAASVDSPTQQEAEMQQEAEIGQGT